MATGSVPKLTRIQNIIQGNNIDYHPANFTKFMLPNVFLPYFIKSQHLRLLKFLNLYDVKNMLVFGLNPESLEFVAEMKKQFPNVGIKVFDFNKDNCITEMYGPDIGGAIIKEYANRGVEFYVKFQSVPEFTNKLGKIRTIQQIVSYSAEDRQMPPAPSLSDNLIKNSISVQLQAFKKLNADCVVLFPNNRFGNNNSKFTEIDYNKKNDQIIVDTHNKSDTRRIFGAGSCVSQDFFFTRDKIQSMNPLVAYQQGLSCGFNVNALNIPFHYIPFEKHTFFDKTVLFAGDRRNFNEMYIMGDVNAWDFIAFYAYQDDIQAVSCSPSRQRQFQLLRECFRLDCQPTLQSMIKQQWTIPMLYKLIRKMNKSGCYQDLIKTLDPSMNIPSVIWMDREKGSFVTNAPEDDDEKNIQVDDKGYTTERF